MFRSFFAVATCLVFGIGHVAADEFPGNLPTFEEVEVVDELVLWATHYRVHTANNQNSGIKLLGRNNTELGPILSVRDFCESAMQGTVVVKDGSEITTFNSLRADRTQFADCVPFYRRAIRLGNISRSTVQALGRMLFFETEVKFGHGVRNWHLSPYRSIAVDSSESPIPYRSVVYIPAAVGRKLTMPDGREVVHDGYFFSVDTGGNIKDDHIDVFGGIDRNNPFPTFVFSTPNPKFKAYVVKSSAIESFMRDIHDAN